MRELYEAGVGGITAYKVHGIRGEASTFLYSKRPFEVDHLPEAVKLEVVCANDSVDKMVTLVAQVARTGFPGDGTVAVQDVERVMKIRDIES